MTDLPMKTETRSMRVGLGASLDSTGIVTLGSCIRSRHTPFFSGLSSNFWGQHGVVKKPGEVRAGS